VIGRMLAQRGDPASAGPGDERRWRTPATGASVAAMPRRDDTLSW